MKILIFSDNHRNRENVMLILSRHQDALHFISLGDSEMSEVELSNLGIYGVRGNYPFEPPFPDELLMTFEGWRFFLAHGHKHGVKNSLTRLYAAAKEQNADVACFGHTHRAFLEDASDLIFLNPGSLQSPRGISYPTYATVDVTETKLQIQVRDAHSGRIIIELIKKR